MPVVVLEVFLKIITGNCSCSSCTKEMKSADSTAMDISLPVLALLVVESTPTTLGMFDFFFLFFFSSGSLPSSSLIMHRRRSLLDDIDL